MSHNNATPPAKPAMNRHQRRMLEACTRKNTAYSHHKNTPLGGNVSSGFGFVPVSSPLIPTKGEK